MRMRILKSQGKNQKERPRYRKRVRYKKRKKNRTPKKLDPNFCLQYLTNILSDARTCLHMYGVTDYTHDIATLRKRIRYEGVSFVTKTLPGLFENFLNYLETGSDSFSNFAKNKRSLPRFLQALTRIVVDPSFASSRVQAFNVLYTFCVSFQKVKGKYSKDVLIKQYDDFCKVDSDLESLSFTDSDPILKTARSYMAEFINNIDIDDGNFIPRPGPGATNRPVEKHMRYEPHVLYKSVDKYLPFYEWFVSHPWDVVNKARAFVQLYNNAQEEPVSRFKFVPKKVGKARGICIEENEVQFLQQAFRRGLQHYMLSSRYRDNINITDQSTNALLALKASKDQSYCTIDMKDASDRISRNLVKYLFQDNPDLCEKLLALSTKYISPPEEAPGPVLRTNKYAPMGSALCFPVMTLSHFMIIKAIILHTGTKTCLKDSGNVYVYGDDIIVPNQYYNDVVNLLPNYGMKINRNKSFTASYFRESCGIHALHGHDVTPVYIKHTPLHRSLGALCSSLANYTQLIKKGLYKTARYLRRELRKQWKFLLLPYVPNNSCLIGFNPNLNIDPSTMHIMLTDRFKKRWNLYHQCYEYRVPMITPKLEKLTINDGASSLLRWYGINSKGDTEVIKRAVDDVTIVYRWASVHSIMHA